MEEIPAKATEERSCKSNHLGLRGGGTLTYVGHASLFAITQFCGERGACTEQKLRLNAADSGGRVMARGFFLSSA